MKNKAGKFQVESMNLNFFAYIQPNYYYNWLQMEQIWKKLMQNLQKEKLPERFFRVKIFQRF
mgnify:CR=1 FL=1